MQKNLVIVESPAKAKTIEKFLGEDFKVMSSYGHIRDLKKKGFGINTDTFEPDYEIPADKKEHVKLLQDAAKKASKVWLASDEDREGEAIAWHLSEVLKLDRNTTERIVFHEITKPAIVAAIESPRHIDMDLVNAQQARRVLDRIVGFKLSPVLWRKVKPGLSAGRVQSVAVRLIVEREKEIANFKSEASYRVCALFPVTIGDKSYELKADLTSRFKTKKDTLAFLEKAKNATFTVTDINTRPVKKSPAPPFTTSTLQQEAARKLSMTVTQTMMIAQRLYESGFITYMRTDSVNLSKLCLEQSKNLIKDTLGEEYVQTRQFATHIKGAQEAHEAIRPTDMSVTQIEGTTQEKRLYDLIRKRTIAGQMADALLEKTTILISMSGSDIPFQTSGQTIKFDGFLKVYHESSDDEENSEDEAILPPLSSGDSLTAGLVFATERFTSSPARYTEASLVHKMEELGIGRPSTYAPTIQTIQQREYVQKDDKPGKERKYHYISLSKGKITEEIRTEMAGAEKGKLHPTDIGSVVNEYLLENFVDIMDYNFTANVEKNFDEIAEGKAVWSDVISSFYKDFEPIVDSAIKSQSERKVGERLIGNDPKTGKPVFAKIGRYGPIVQIGSAQDEEKPCFAQMKKEQSLDTITLEEALSLFALPRTLKDFENCPIVIGSGKFGPYIKHDNKYISIPKTYDPLQITFEESVKLIMEKRKQDEERHIKSFAEDPEMEVLNGRFGPYICYKKSNYRLPKNIQEPKELTYEECLAIIENESKKSSSTKKKKK